MHDDRLVRLSLVPLLDEPSLFGKSRDDQQRITVLACDGSPDEYQQQRASTARSWGANRENTPVLRNFSRTATSKFDDVPRDRAKAIVNIIAHRPGDRYTRISNDDFDGFMRRPAVAWPTTA
jgi:hypothetical protein